MAETMVLQIIKPDGEFYRGDVTMVELNTAVGQLGIYPQHIPETVAVAPGILTIHMDAELKKAALLSGFMQVMPEQVTILAEAAEWPEEIDVKRAERAKERAEERLRQRRSEQEYRRNKIALARAMARLSLTKRKTTL